MQLNHIHFRKHSRKHLTVSKFNWFAFIAVTENHQQARRQLTSRAKIFYTTFFFLSSPLTEIVQCNITSAVKYFLKCVLMSDGNYNMYESHFEQGDVLQFRHETCTLNRLFTYNTDQWFFCHNYSFDFKLTTRESLKYANTVKYHSINSQLFFFCCECSFPWSNHCEVITECLCNVMATAQSRLLE